jgi:phenylacetate-CoA ligase
VLGSLVYRLHPVWAQELFLAARSAVRNRMREGRAFETVAAQLHESQWWPEARLRDFQRRELRQVIEASLRDVPYYRGRYRRLLAEPAHADIVKLIEHLPVIGKAEVREAGRALISERRRGPLFQGSTSGTTGTPLTLYQDLHAITRENAFIWRQLSWAGMRRGDRRAWIRGDMIVPAGQRHPPFWRMNRAENMLMLSSYHLSDRAARAYVEALGRFDPVVIQAYPSSIAFLAGWMLSARAHYHGGALRGIVTSSETLSEAQRRDVERAFGCRVFDWYGQFERVAAIGTCERGGRHLITDYSYVELLPVEDGLFELVGTGFNNLSMPLIRYRCGDRVRLRAAGERCPCGRSFPLIDQVLGRVDDAIKLPDGRSVGRLDHLFKGVEGILEAQIRQDRLDAVTILVVPAPTYTDRTREVLRGNARHRLGDGIELDIRLVDAIPRTRNGKLKGVVCNV